MNFPKLCFSMMQLLFLRKEREFVSHLNDLQRHLGSLSVLKSHRAADVLLQGEGKGTEDPRQLCTMKMCVHALQLCGKIGQSMSPAEKLQHKLKLCKELHCRLWDSTFIFKLVGSSTVHSLRLCEREIICPRVDSTVLTLSCWEGWCAQLTLLWKVEVILVSLHFANSGE